MGREADARKNARLRGRIFVGRELALDGERAIFQQQSVRFPKEGGFRMAVIRPESNTICTSGNRADSASFAPPEAMD